ncbi:MAG: hypothetical protein K9H16_09670 [Bacteroidales bacterium]|nr:hypothetical protein [Bacteroidales bacterium]
MSKDIFKGGFKAVIVSAYNEFLVENDTGQKFDENCSKHLPEAAAASNETGGFHNF